MDDPPTKPHPAEFVNMTMLTVSMVLGGAVIGTACARAMPASSPGDLLPLAAGLSVLTACVVQRLREDAGPVPREEEPPTGIGPGARPPARGEGPPGSRPTDEGPLARRDSGAGASISSACDSLLSAASDCTDDSPPLRTVEPPGRIGEAPEPNLIRERVEQEMRRLSLRGMAEPVAVRATAHSLRFRDASGRDVRYALRSSRKKSRATVLEAQSTGDRKPRRVRSVTFDRDSCILSDGGEDYVVPSPHAEAVLRGLSLLCKVSGVPLESGGEPPVPLLQRRTMSCHDLAAKASSDDGLPTGSISRVSMPSSTMRMRKTMSSHVLSQMVHSQ